MQQICVLCHGAPENQEVCQLIQEEKQEQQSKTMTEPRRCSCGGDVVASIVPSTYNGVVVGYRGSLTHTECESSCG